MLKKFSVSNFKCFDTEISFDLGTNKGYTFNPSCIKNGIINNCVIYGHNGCGKSNLGLAIFDIIEHLTDKYREVNRYHNYLNAVSKENVASFSYEFLLDGVTVRYDYKKTDYKTIVSENLWIDDEKVIAFDRTNANKTFSVNLKGAETLNPMIDDASLSVLKYIKNNTVLADNASNKAFRDFYSFVEHMLFFRSLEDRTYIGQEVDNNPITSEIIKRDRVKELESFLNEANVKCKLTVVDTIKGKDIAFDFGEKKIILAEAMSTGTSSMMLFFYWYLLISETKVSFLFIDEFDAFYHYDLSKLIVRKLMETGTQFIVTTHNISLMSNDLMRPDCYYLMGNNRIQPLSSCTDKELRQVHNIEKIYKAGGFYVK